MNSNNKPRRSTLGCRARRFFVGVVAAAIGLIAPAQAQNLSNPMGNLNVVGNWYLALDAGPFDPGLAGLYLSGLAQIHFDRTFMISDAGDFAAQSFLPTFASPQYGAWKVQGSKRNGFRIVGTALHLEADGQTGEAIGWNKVEFNLMVVARDRLEGTVNVFFLPCGNPPMVPTPLSCPDPVANAAAFGPAAPPDIPVTFTRIKAGQ